MRSHHDDIADVRAGQVEAVESLGRFLGQPQMDVAHTDTLRVRVQSNTSMSGPDTTPSLHAEQIGC